MPGHIGAKSYADWFHKKSSFACKHGCGLRDFYIIRLSYFRILIGSYTYDLLEERYIDDVINTIGYLLVYQFLVPYRILTPSEQKGDSLIKNPPQISHETWYDVVTGQGDIKNVVKRGGKLLFATWAANTCLFSCLACVWAVVCFALVCINISLPFIQLLLFMQAGDIRL